MTKFMVLPLKFYNSKIFNFSASLITEKQNFLIKCEIKTTSHSSCKPFYWLLPWGR